jgi:pantothenate synthetase
LSVLGVVARLFPPQTGPVERIDYRRRSEGLAKPRRRATLTRQARQRVHREMERLAADRKFTEAEGVIRQIDLDAQTFILRERPDNQADLPCEYPKTLAEMAKELLDCRVLVSGLLETSRLTHRSKMEAEAIEPLGGDEERVDEPENAARTA